MIIAIGIVLWVSLWLCRIIGPESYRAPVWYLIVITILFCAALGFTVIGASLLSIKYLV